MAQSNTKGSLDFETVIKFVLLMATVVIIFLVVGSIVGKGMGGVDGGTKTDYLSLAATYCEVRCPLICYGRECEDSDECVYENKGLENPIKLSCTNLHLDDDDTPASSNKPGMTGIFKPCGKMTVTYTGATEDFGAVRVRLCEDITKPGTCKKLYKTLGNSPEALPDVIVNVDGVDHKYYKLCDPDKCTVDSKGKIKTEFYLPCDNTLTEKKTFTLKIEPYSNYGEQKLALKWACPTVSYPKGIHPGPAMPVKFSDFIAEKAEDMQANLIIKNGCYASDNSYLTTCKKTNDLAFKTGTSYEYDAAMPWINTASADNSIIFEIKPSATGPVVCKAGGFFAWSCPDRQCWNHDAKDYVLTGLDATGTKKPNPSCAYTTEAECTLPCVAAPTDFLKGDCKDTETKFEIKDIYTLSEYPYKCSGGKDDLPYRHDKNGKQICKFDATGHIKEDGLTDNYKKIYKTCDSANELNKGNSDCKCDASGKLAAGGSNPNCRFPVCSVEPYDYSPTGTEVCMCDLTGKLQKGGPKVCPKFINDGSDAFRIDTDSFFDIEIKNTGAVDAKIEASKVAVTFDGAPITPGAFVKVLKEDRTADSNYNNEQDYTLTKGYTIIYEFRANIPGVETKTYPIRAVLSYLDRTAEKTDNVAIYGKCCNGCTCPAGDICNACAGYCRTTFTGDCYFG